VTGINKPQKANKIGLKPKNLIGIPWKVAFALQDDGWVLRQDIIWSKPNPMPESVRDRCTKSHEYIFLLSKSPKYYFDANSIKEPTVTKDNTNRDRDTTKLNNTPGRTKMAGLKTNNYDLRNKRSVWTVTPKPYKGAHFATFPPDLIEPCILAGSKAGDVVLDPFGGSGTTAGVALKHGRKAVLCELNPEYAGFVEDRVEKIVKG
jgi:site-specific DNA-methyltransferase (adenine-specific)